MMNKNITLLLFMIFILGCSQNVKLQSAPEVSRFTNNNLGLKASVCPRTETFAPKNTKFLFMVDMSVSNIGGWIHEPAPNGGKYSFWDPTQQTDYNGDRFKAIETVLNTCGSQTGNEYSVVGFSNTAGVLRSGDNKAVLSCNTSFGSAPSALSDLNNLHQAQVNEAPWYEKWENKHLTSSDWPGILGATSYSSAMQCAENIMIEELTDLSESGTENYHLFLLSDGLPSDGPGVGCNTVPKEDVIDCFMETMLEPTKYMSHLAIARQKNLRIHTVYYGNAPAPSGIEPTMFLDAIASNGGTHKAVTLNTFSEEPEALCKLVESQLAIDFQPDFAMAINLTTKRVGGQLYADSDMDGLTDFEESDLGYDPKKARSIPASGLLDSICEKIGGPQQCLSKMQGTCDPLAVNNFGLTECDIKALGLGETLPTEQQGIDSDKDGMPDFIEILKGTNPVLKDMTADSDSDSKTNQEEILAGTDPFKADLHLSPSEQSQVDVRYTGKSNIPDDNCEYGAWELKVDWLPSTANLPVSSTFAFEPHNVNQQVIMLLYRLAPRNSPQQITEFYGTTIKADYRSETSQAYNDKGQSITSTIESLRLLQDSNIVSGSYELLGSVPQ